MCYVLPFGCEAKISSHQAKILALLWNTELQIKGLSESNNPPPRDMYASNRIIPPLVQYSDGKQGNAWICSRSDLAAGTNHGKINYHAWPSPPMQRLNQAEWLEAKHCNGIRVHLNVSWRGELTYSDVMIEYLVPLWPLLHITWFILLIGTELILVYKKYN